jgi:hypothetical protein
MKNRTELDVTDQGRWNAAGEGVGVASMREMIKQVGGSLSIIPSGRGTQIHAVVPNDFPARVPSGPMDHPALPVDRKSMASTRFGSGRSKFNGLPSNKRRVRLEE